MKTFVSDHGWVIRSIDLHNSEFKPQNNYKGSITPTKFDPVSLSYSLFT